MVSGREESKGEYKEVIVEVAENSRVKREQIFDILGVVKYQMAL